MEIPPPSYEYRVIVMKETQTQGAPQELAERVRKAFEDVRRKDLQGVSQLQHAGQAVIPLVTPWLRDTDEIVRREAISLLSVIGGEAALPLLVAALGDSSRDIRHKTALALYENYKPTMLVQQTTLGPALVRLIRSEPACAAALLLSAYYPTEEMEAALIDASQRKPTVEVKLYGHSAPVRILLPLQVAQARHGSPEASAALIKTIENASVSEAEFLIEASQEMDSASVLKAMSRFLDDTRPCSTMVHSAPNIRLRVCDMSVNALIKRFDLQSPVKTSRLQNYTASDIETIRSLLMKAVPDRPVPDRPVPALVKPE